MNTPTFLQLQAIQLQELLASAADDPILEPQLRERLTAVESELEASRREEGSLLPRESFVLPRAAIFLRGGGVEASVGIRPNLAGEALIQYERMFTEQALHDERQAARTAGRQRRPRGSPTPGLLFTGTPRGSFGLEFVPQHSDDGSLLKVHALSFRNVAAALVRIVGNDEASLDEVVKQVPPRVLQPLAQFLKVLAEHRAELRLAFPDEPSTLLTVNQVQIAADRIQRDVVQEILKLEGTFRGVTRESGVFDLRMDDDTVITGTVADNLTEEDLERIDLLTNNPCTVEVQKTTVRTVAGSGAPTYILLEAQGRS